MEIPGIADLVRHGVLYFGQVSCSSPGNCSAGGSYYGEDSEEHAFLVDQVNGNWRTAQHVPGLESLDTGGRATLLSISCGLAGSCSAGGSFTTSADTTEAFLVDRLDGVWRTAHHVPGLASLNTSGYAAVQSLSCTTSRNCTAGGYYYDGRQRQQAFLVSQESGRWRQAVQAPGTDQLGGKGGGAQIHSVSCVAPGRCGAVGTFDDGQGYLRAFAVTQHGGRLSAAVKISGSMRSYWDSGYQHVTLSCASERDCSAGGSLSQAWVGTQAWTADYE